MDKILQIIKETKCVGCGSCSQSCHKDAITMRLNNEGFYTPSIDEALCVHCGTCSKACPVLNVSYNNSESPDCYAMMADDEIRKVSSSGGAFTVIAKTILKKKGLVCGVAYSDDYKQTRYAMIDSEAQLSALRGSKYIMCDTGDIYINIKQKLKEGKQVLFCGLPCHVAALRAFLKGEYISENLLTVDLICHGIPSVKAFDHYMRDVHARRHIKQLGFKDKRFGWHAGMTIEFDNNELFHMPCEKDSFFISYLNGLNKNRSCGKCPFARIPRQGDITIGDFWGIAKYDPTLNDGNGTSVMLINSERGMKYVDEIKRHSKLFVPVPIEYAINGNRNLVQSPSVKTSQSQFLRRLDTRRYPDLVKWGFDDDRYDVGIVGIPIFPNFGGTLTYYSIYRSLKDMGYTVALFSRPRSTGKPPVIPDEVYNNCPFDNQDLKLDFKDKRAMGQFANANCESFVVGSDQLFNSDLYKAFGEIVTLDWVDDNHRKIAYAASFGHNYFWGSEAERSKMAYYMQKFDAFSVREEEATVLAKKVFGVDAVWVLDPVFLCNPKHYIDVAENSAVKCTDKHIFAYILDPSPEKENIVSLMEKKLGMNAEVYSEMLYKPTSKSIDEWQDKFRHKLLQGKVEDRLYSLIHSDLVIADSFHGICFAIIFNIPFIAILNPLRGASRFYTILGKLNLLNRMVTSVNEVQKNLKLFISNAGLAEAQEIIKTERLRCLSWLRNSITPVDEVKKGFSAEDIVNQKLLTYNRMLNYNDLKVNMALSERKYLLKRNIYDYLDELIKDKSQLIIFISVKDTPGYALNDRIALKLNRLGLKQNLINKHWHSYVAVISSGRVINEVISKAEERVAYVGTLPCGKVKVVSRSFNSGNIAYIGINDTDYSENRRGLNIVVYDKVIGEVIDSVCFDTHESSIPYFRYKKRYSSVMPLSLKYETDQVTDNEAVRVQPPNGLQAELLSVFYCCRITVEHCQNRKIVLWEDNPAFRKVLSECFHVDANIVVTEKQFSNDSLSFIKPSELKDKQDRFYVVIPNKKWDISDEIRLNQLGYSEIQDYVFYNIRPIVLKNRDYGTEPYHDVYGNSISGGFSHYTTIIIRGYNNTIIFGDHLSVKEGASLLFDVSSNTFVSLCNKVRVVGSVNIVGLGACSKIISIGNGVVFVDNQLRVFGDVGTEEIRIGDRTTFNTNTCLHVNAGKKLIIGEDVMFSLNIRVLCGDGHSLFDVNSENNINSIPNQLEKSKNELVIGDHVWVGINVLLMAGCSVGNGSIIGANSVVKSTFPNNCAIGGVPAKILKRDVAWSRKNCSDNLSDCDMQYVNPTYESSEINGKNILVLGGTKLVGVRLVEKLLEMDCNVTIATRGQHTDPFGDNVTRVIIDRNNEESIVKAFAGKKYDVVFDSSAYTPQSVRYSLSHLLCDRYIMVSTAAVYENSQRLRVEKMVDPYHLGYHVGGTFPYGISKKYAECVLCQEFGTQSSAIIRVPAVLDEFNLSDGKYSDRLFFYVEHIMKEIPFCEKNLNRVCSFVRTTDEADFLIFLASNSYNGVFNFSSFGHITMIDIISYIEQKTNKKAIIIEDGENNPFPFGGYELDLSRLDNVHYNTTNISDWIYSLIDRYIDIISSR